MPLSPTSTQGTIKGCTAEGPGKAGAMKSRPAGATQFRKFYERGDFPVAIEFDTKGNKIAWKVEIEKLDFHHYLPLFFDGLCETTHPYDFFARAGIEDMLEHGGAKILPVIPQLIIPIKNALNTRDPQIVCCTLKILQKLVQSAPLVGEALEFVLVGYDKVCAMAEAVYTETPREVLEAYKPKSAVTTSGGAMQNMIAKKPTSDKEVLEDTSRLIKLASDQLKAFHAKGLLTTNGPPKEFELVSALGAAVHGKAVKQQVSSITGEISRMDEGRNDFAKGVALATTNAIEVEATRCNGEVLAWKFVQKLEKEIEKTKAALLKEKAEAKLEMLKAMLAESEAKLQGKQAEWDRAMAAFRAPETSIAAGVLKATESYGKAVLQLCVARGKNGAYAKWLEYLASKGLTEETYTLAEAVEEADIDETAGEAAPDDMGAEIKKA